MEAGIFFEKKWSDDDLIELEVVASDGRSQFCTRVYVGHDSLTKLATDLDRFKSHIHGGVFDVCLGEFGPEYANGAFHARLHFHPPGRGILFITVHAESDWREFTKTQVANEATLHVTTEPALLDTFVAELRALESGRSTVAVLRLRDHG